MNDIDFLPADYVPVRATRSDNYWLRGLFAIVLTLMSLGWMAMRHSNNGLASRRDLLKSQVAHLNKTLGTGEDLRQELSDVERQGRLLDLLRFNIPPSRWLAAVATTLPPQVSLREVRSTVEDLVDTKAKSTFDSRPKDSDENKSDRPLERDLDRLSKQIGKKVVTVSLTGTADDDQAISAFLASLQRTKLFESVQLLFTDQGSDHVESQRDFAIRLRIHPIAGRIP